MVTGAVKSLLPVRSGLKLLQHFIHDHTCREGGVPYRTRPLLSWLLGEQVLLQVKHSTTPSPAFCINRYHF